MTYTIQVHGSKTNGSPEETSAEVEGAIRMMVQQLEAHGHSIGGGQTRLPDGRTVDALNIASGGPSATAEPANSPNRASGQTQGTQTASQTSGGAQDAQKQPQTTRNASQASSGPAPAPQGARGTPQASQGNQKGSEQPKGSSGTPTGSAGSSRPPSGQKSTSKDTSKDTSKSR